MTAISKIADLLSNSVDVDPLIRQAINKIFSSYGDNVSVRSKAKDLIKFGSTLSMETTPSTIWYTGQDDQNETYVADNVNSIDTLSSSSAADTEIVDVEGHTMAAGVRTFVTQPLTLNGQNKVVLTTPLNRISRIRHAMESAVDIVGEVYGYEDTPLDAAGKPVITTLIHITMPAGKNTSEKASTSLSDLDYWILTGYHAALQQKTVNLIATVEMQIRPVGGVFYPASDPIVVFSGRTVSYFFKPYIVVPKNADIRLVGTASAGTTAVSGGISGFLAKVK